MREVHFREINIHFRHGEAAPALALGI